jgi:hypothetical protein
MHFKRLFIFILLFLIILCTFLAPTLAKVSDINFNNIPDSKEITKIKETILNLEPMVTNWTQNWNYKVPKDQVVKQITESYKKLDALSKQYPNNIELVLFKGLVAHFAYQLDLKDYKELALSDFNKAALIDSNDIRPDWFSGVHLVKLGKIKDGMEKLLSISKSKPFDQLPGTFWEDFSYCALISSMPSHALMGLEYANKIEGKQSEMDQLIGPIVKNRFKQPPADDQTINKDEVWDYIQNSDLVTFTNRLFDFSLQVPMNWRIGLGDYQKNSNAIMLNPPAKTGLSGSVNSTIMILAHKPKNDETFDKFVNSMLDPRLTFKEVEKSFTFGPVKAFEGETTTSYANEGGAHCLIVFFSRNQPEKPGLLLESPLELPKEESGLAYYHSKEVFTKIPGTIYYFVLLDTTQSTFIESKNELEKLLSTLIVE